MITCIVNLFEFLNILWINLQVQGTSNHAIFPTPKTQNGSFGPEYDEDLLCAMDKLEKDYMTETERIKSGVADQMNFATAKDHPEKIVPVIAHVEVDMLRQCSPGNIHSVKFAHVIAVDTATNQTHTTAKNHKQQSKALETSKLEALTLAMPSCMVTEIVKGHLSGNAELDFSSTWETPLHISTPANGNKGTGKHRLSRCPLKTSNQAIDTPKALSTKSREKTKLFQAILNSDNENDNELFTNRLITADLIGNHSHSSSSCDRAISSATSHKNHQLPGMSEFSVC